MNDGRTLVNKMIIIVHVLCHNHVSYSQEQHVMYIGRVPRENRIVCVY